VKFTEWPDAYCRTCGARPGEACVTTFGNLAPKPHKAREPRRRRLHEINYATRGAVNRRSGGRCEFREGEMRCHARATRMHHRRMRSQGGPDTASNLVHLCEAHHNYIHAFPAWAADNGYLERTQA
jgi:hypothetical protein